MKKWSLLLVLALLIAVMVIPAQAAEIPTDVQWIELDSKEDFLEWFSGTTKAKNLTENYSRRNQFGTYPLLQYSKQEIQGRASLGEDCDRCYIHQA